MNKFIFAFKDFVNLEGNFIIYEVDINNMKCNLVSFIPKEYFLKDDLKFVENEFGVLVIGICTNTLLKNSSYHYFPDENIFNLFYKNQDKFWEIYISCIEFFFENLEKKNK